MSGDTLMLQAEGADAEPVKMSTYEVDDVIKVSLISESLARKAKGNIKLLPHGPETFSDRWGGVRTCTHRVSLRCWREGKARIAIEDFYILKSTGHESYLAIRLGLGQEIGLGVDSRSHTTDPGTEEEQTHMTEATGAAKRLTVEDLLETGRKRDLEHVERGLPTARMG